MHFLVFFVDSVTKRSMAAFERAAGKLLTTQYIAVYNNKDNRNVALPYPLWGIETNPTQKECKHSVTYLIPYGELKLHI